MTVTRKSFFPLLFSLLALLLLSPLTPRAWELTPPVGLQQGLQPIPLPASYELLDSPPQADLNGDGHPEMLRLADGRLAILSGTQAGWQSPASWRVAQAAFSDLNRDGLPEVALLVWRPFRPWPVDAWLPHGGRISEFHDAEGQSCHLILIGWKRGVYRELWAGSALAEPVRAFAATDLDADGKEELVVLEAAYDDPPSKTANRLKVWEWNGFGFSAVSMLEGRFRQMQIVRAPDGRVLILAP
ncbi:MAG: VCBS repeat-containing protein [Anaerolineales bacterium]|nr:VCBS repeat-containing protein [Anaerolineales bacterium]